DLRDAPHGGRRFGEATCAEVEVGEVAVRVAVARLAELRGLDERRLGLLEAEERARGLGVVGEVDEERERAAAATRVDGLLAGAVARFLVSRLELDGALRVEGDLLLLRIAAREGLAHRRARLVD